MVRAGPRRLPARRGGGECGDEAAELQLAKDVEYVVAGELAETRLIEIETRGRGGVDGDERLALLELFRVVADEALNARRLDLVDAPDEGLDAAEILNELYRGLRFRCRVRRERCPRCRR